MCFRFDFLAIDFMYKDVLVMNVNGCKENCVLSDWDRDVASDNLCAQELIIYVTVDLIDGSRSCRICCIVIIYYLFTSIIIY